MRKSVRDSIRQLVDNLHLLDIRSIKNEYDFQKIIEQAKTLQDMEKAAFAYLKFIVESPDHKPFILHNWYRYLIDHEVPVAASLIGNQAIDIIINLAKLWYTPTLKEAEKTAEIILCSILSEMHNQDKIGLLYLTHKRDSMDQSFDDYLLHKQLLRTALLLPCIILGEKASDIITNPSRFRYSSVSDSAIPLFAYESADYLWREDKYAAASALYQKAITATDDLSEWRLSEDNYLDAYNCWGLCEIEQNNLEVAYSIYKEAIDQYEANKSKYLGRIYANMAYVCGSLSESVEESESNASSAKNEESTGDQNKRKEDYLEQAIYYVNRSIENDENAFHSRFTLATLHYDKNELNQACTYYEQALPYAQSPFDKLSVLRTYIEIRLDQVYDGISINENDLIEKLSHYFTQYTKAKNYGRTNSEYLDEMDTAETILSIYNPQNIPALFDWKKISEVTTKDADLRDEEENELIKSKDIGLCLLKIHVCSERIRARLRYSPKSNKTSENQMTTGVAEPIIAYYTTLANAKYLLDKTKPNQELLSEKEEANWPDAPKSPDQAQNRLTMMHVYYMNDPNEGHPLIKDLAQKLDDGNLKNYLFIGSTHETFRKKLLDEKFVFLKSFTSLVDQLSMWSTYASDRSSGSDSNGCCICIEPKTFQMMQEARRSSQQSKDKNGDDLRLYHVAYIRKREKMDNGVKKIKTELIIPNMRSENKKDLLNHYNHLIELFKKLNILLQVSPTHETLSSVWRGLSHSLSFIAFLFKDASYAPEQELRLIVTRSKSNRGEIQHTAETPPKLFVMPPHQIFVKQIILGPKVLAPDRWIPHLQFKLAEMWESWPKSDTNPPIPKVRKSSINYRD